MKNKYFLLLYEDVEDHKKNVILLGITSFFNDISSEAIFSILPLYIQSQTEIGLLSGIIKGLGNIFKVYFGYLSDRMGIRKRMVISGYLTSAIAKIIIPFANLPLLVFSLTLDRLGKGIRTGARDAILAEAKKKGWAFGFHRAMDTLGAIMGSLLAYALLSIGWNYRTAMLVAAGLGFLALIPLIFVIEPDVEPIKRGFVASLEKTPEPLKKFLVLGVLFGLALVSPMLFISSAAKTVGLASLLFFTAFNILYALSARFLGSLSDSLGRSLVLSISIVSALFSFLAMIMGQYLAGFVLYGISYGSFDAVSKALVSEISGKEKATGLGLFQTLQGLSFFFGSAILGYLLQHFGNMGYFFPAVLSLISILYFIMIKKEVTA